MSLVDHPREPVSSIPDMLPPQNLDEPSYRSSRSASASHSHRNDDSDFTDSLTDESEYESADDQPHREEDDDADDEDSMKPADKHVAVARAIPALPVKSSMRASRLLDDLTPLKVGSDDQPVLSQAPPPHTVYLSSEEDASSSADDFSDFDFESDSDMSPTESRSSHEITARAISVIFAGKPSIIQVSPRSSSPESAAAESPTSPRPRAQRITTDTNLLPRQSESAAAAQRARYSTFMTPEEMDKATRPEFLDTDPFPSPPEGQEDALPKSPTGTGSHSRFKRSFSLVRKRSKSTLDNASIYSRESTSTQTLPLEQQQQPEDTREYSLSSEKQAAPSAPTNYQQMVQSARGPVQSPPADAAPAPPASKPKSRFGFMGRRRAKA